MGFFDSFSKAFENDPEYSDGRGMRKSVSGILPTTRAFENESFDLEVMLTGIPRTDPSSDLFGPATRATEGFDTGGEVLTVPVTFLVDGVLLVGETDFTEGENGKWQLDKSGNSISMAFQTLGFERTFVTKGSIQTVFGGADTSRTSSGYFIPTGPCLLQASVRLSATGLPILSDGELLAPVKAGWGSAMSYKRAGGVVSAKRKTTSSD
mmetsp:Transcript_98/g.168  ORF Transcript_98/g.168 Transcript_98/m.168 type:complete len:209 (-) Transcript_98:305-931(-)